MKKKLSRLFILSAILFAISFTATAQVYVKIRPAVPVIVRPPQPTQSHVWINEEWEPNGNTYRYSGGHWDAPPHEGYTWRTGYWKHRRHHGEQWIPGAWRKR